MSEIDRVFARFQDGRSTSTDRREVRTVPGRGTRGSRVVEVVHLRSGAPAANGEAARQAGASLRAATWDEGFPARQAPQPPMPEPPRVVAAVEPTVHLMPAWEPTVPAAPVAEEPVAVEVGPPPAVRPSRRAIGIESRPIADPFDSADEGANCLRCGYLVEPARERRGLMTCAACG